MEKTVLAQLTDSISTRCLLVSCWFRQRQGFWEFKMLCMLCRLVFTVPDAVFLFSESLPSGGKDKSKTNKIAHRGTVRWRNKRVRRRVREGCSRGRGVPRWPGSQRSCGRSRRNWMKMGSAQTPSSRDKFQGHTLLWKPPWRVWVAKGLSSWARIGKKRADAGTWAYVGASQSLWKTEVKLSWFWCKQFWNLHTSGLQRAYGK